MSAEKLMEPVASVQLDKPGLTLERAAQRVRDTVMSHLAIEGEKRIVEFVHELFLLARQIGSIGCGAQDNDTLTFLAFGYPLCEVQLECARGMLRTVCARLAVVSSKQSGRDFAPYGDEAEFDYVIAPAQLEHFRVRYANTTGQQYFRIESQEYARN